MRVNINYNAKFYSIALKLHQKAQAKLMEVGRDTTVEGLEKVIDDVIRVSKASIADLKDLKKRIAN